MEKENCNFETIIVAGDEYSVPAERMTILEPFITRGLASNKWTEKFNNEEKIIIYSNLSKHNEARSIIETIIDNDEPFDFHYVAQNGLVMLLGDWKFAEYLYYKNIWDESQYARYQCNSGVLYDTEFFDRYFALPHEMDGATWMDEVVNLCTNDKGQVLCRIVADEYVLSLMKDEKVDDICELLVGGIIEPSFQTLYEYITKTNDLTMRSRLVSLFLNMKDCENCIHDEGVDIYNVIDEFIRLGIDLSFVKLPVKFLLAIIKDKRTLLARPEFREHLMKAIAASEDIFTLISVIKDFVDLTDFEKCLIPKHTVYLTFFEIHGINIKNRYIMMSPPSSHMDKYAVYDKYTNAIYDTKGAVMTIDEYINLVGKGMLDSQLDELTEFTVDAYIINRFIKEVKEYAISQGLITETEENSEPIDIEDGTELEILTMVDDDYNSADYITSNQELADQIFKDSDDDDLSDYVEESDSTPITEDLPEVSDDNIEDGEDW